MDTAAVPTALSEAHTTTRDRRVARAGRAAAKEGAVTVAEEREAIMLALVALLVVRMLVGGGERGGHRRWRLGRRGK
jgi:hypothetical protein